MYGREMMPMARMPVPLVLAVLLGCCCALTSVAPSPPSIATVAAAATTDAVHDYGSVVVGGGGGGGGGSANQRAGYLRRRSPAAPNADTGIDIDGSGPTVLASSRRRSAESRYDDEHYGRKLNFGPPPSSSSSEDTSDGDDEDDVDGGDDDESGDESSGEKESGDTGQSDDENDGIIEPGQPTKRPAPSPAPTNDDGRPSVSSSPTPKPVEQHVPPVLSPTAAPTPRRAGSGEGNNGTGESTDDGDDDDDDDDDGSTLIIACPDFSPREFERVEVRYSYALYTSSNEDEDDAEAALREFERDMLHYVANEVLAHCEDEPDDSHRSRSRLTLVVQAPDQVPEQVSGTASHRGQRRNEESNQIFGVSSVPEDRIVGACESTSDDGKACHLVDGMMTAYATDDTDQVRCEVVDAIQGYMDHIASEDASFVGSESCDGRYADPPDGVIGPPPDNVDPRSHWSTAAKIAVSTGAFFFVILALVVAKMVTKRQSARGETAHDAAGDVKADPSLDTGSIADESYTEEGSVDKGDTSDIAGRIQPISKENAANTCAHGGPAAAFCGSDRLGDTEESNRGPLPTASIEPPEESERDAAAKISQNKNICCGCCCGCCGCSESCCTGCCANDYDCLGEIKESIMALKHTTA